MSANSRSQPRRSARKRPVQQRSRDTVETILIAAALVWGMMVVVVVAARRPAEQFVPPISTAALPFGTLSPAGGSLHFSASAGDREPLGAAGGAATATWGLAYAMPDVRKALDLAGEYVALTKPDILTLLLATTLGGMLAGAASLPSIWLIVATLAPSARRCAT